MASLHGQPQSHPITLEKLLGEEEGIPIELGELFSKIVNGLNALSREDTAFLSEPSGDKNPTQPSRLQAIKRVRLDTRATCKAASPSHPHLHSHPQRVRSPSGGRKAEKGA
jgi:hypothetical protein